MLGHKADLAFMALGADLWQLSLQTALSVAGLEVVDSLRVAHRAVASTPRACPRRCTRPGCTRSSRPRASRRGASTRCRSGAGAEQNWFTLPYDERKELMYEHGAVGPEVRRPHRCSSSPARPALDDYEWGVTLFAEHPDDLKEVVYTMRFDRASAHLRRVRPVLHGLVAPVDEVLDRVGADRRAGSR